MQSGVIAGMAFEIDGFINAYAAKYGNFNAVLTGVILPILPGSLKTRYLPTITFYSKACMHSAKLTIAKEFYPVLLSLLDFVIWPLPKKNSPYSRLWIGRPDTES